MNEKRVRIFYFKKDPENTKRVSRPSRWGNPFSLKDYSLKESLQLYEDWLIEILKKDPTFLHPLRNYNLGCFCKLGNSCHVDIILKYLYWVPGPKKMKEIEFVDLFCKYLDSLNFEYKRELRKGSYHQEGYVDIVIKNNGLLIAIEAKMSGNSEVISQASRIKSWFPYCYILVPKITEKMMLKCKNFGIGVILPSNKIFEVIVKPQALCFRKFFWKDWYYRVIRNWIQNRMGRPIQKGSKEIPEDYDMDKLQEINPTYEWVGKTWDPHIIDYEELGFKIYPKKEPIIAFNKEKQKYEKNKNHSLFEYL